MIIVSDMSQSIILDKYAKDTSKVICVQTLQSPIGEVIAVADDDFLFIVSFEDSKNLERKFQTLSEEIPCRFVEKNNKLLKKFQEELTAYFDGKLKKFTIPIKTLGSEFQKEVWNKLQELPYASTQTYGDLAKALGRSASHARAVGAACGANAHLLVVPCHRLVSAGSKGGFSSGIERKEWLLQHEQKHCTI